MPSIIETIDGAVYKWLDEEMNIFSTTNKGWKKVPVIWTSAERAHQIKNKKELRDSTGTLILPLVSIERTAIAKDPGKKGSAWAHIPPTTLFPGDIKGGSITIARRVQQEKTSNFASADAVRKRGNSKDVGSGQLNFPRKNKKTVYETITIPMPVYVTVTYNISILAEYQQQMNEIVTPFITKTGGINYFIATNEGHRYEGFIKQDFAQDNNAAALGTDLRQYKTDITIDILGYLIGEDKNAEQPKIIVRENAVQVRMPRERVIQGDIPAHIDPDIGFFRE